MLKLLDPFRFLLTSLAGWMNQRQLQAIDYLREENRVLREQLGSRRLRLTDDQRRRLAVKAKGLGRKLLVDMATIVTPETLLAWHRRLNCEPLARNRRPNLCIVSGSKQMVGARGFEPPASWSRNRISAVPCFHGRPRTIELRKV